MEPGLFIAVGAFIWGVLVWWASQRKVKKTNGALEDSVSTCLSLRQRIVFLEDALARCAKDRDRYLRDRTNYMRLYAEELAKKT